ncbi:YbaB/EbfC family nucleoid-associated protein [Streptomyces sp. ADI93-02]|uniref:YbaB/EbfC family nucleoid-associated protein n=1 Tax=Streptomyces sp. ADI93-02 TaxID=1522757 RepID=UPI000FB6F8CE|nr:YbaB/EbfC family nucleoid-associated protein [Streptomyces sp. ADI93-02]RPK33290.1 Nucleoid-associated protein YbaB [Streptomyces sp. ADI93-02]
MNNNPLQAFLDEVQSQMDEALEQAGQAQAALSEISATATSKDHLVTATVDARGTLTELKFNSSRFRSMAPTELAALLTETIGKAQEDVHGQMMETFGGVDGHDLDSVKDLLSDRPEQAELHEMLDAFVNGRLPGQHKAD